MYSRRGDDRRRVLGWIVAVVLLLTCWRVWLGPVDLLPRAAAQIPDAGLQRLELVEEARRTNQLLAEILTALQSGAIKVRIEGADNPAAGAATPTRKRR